MKKIIGITGGIGSGKTTVSKIIEKEGFSVYNSDQRAKDIVNFDKDLKQKIITLLGNDAYDVVGIYNRKWVGQRVFEDHELLKNLNAIIHPAVKSDFENWVRLQTTPWVFKETALLFELQLHKICFKNILVTADENIRIKRVMERDGRTYRETKEIIDKQMPESDKIKLADFVIYNNTDFNALKEETLKVLDELK